MTCSIRDNWGKFAKELGVHGGITYKKMVQGATEGLGEKPESNFEGREQAVKLTFYRGGSRGKEVGGIFRSFKGPFLQEKIKERQSKGRLKSAKSPLLLYSGDSREKGVRADGRGKTRRKRVSLGMGNHKN